MTRMDGTPTLMTAFILAGGSSRRMGCDKAGLKWGAHTLLEHMQTLLREVTPIVEVVGRGALPDRSPGDGPVEGIRTALAATTTEDNLIVALDLPFLDVRILHHMAHQLRGGDRPLVVCDVGTRTPLCLGARKCLLPIVERYRETGRRSLGGLIEDVDHHTLTLNDIGELGVNLDVDVFRNLNTHEDYEDALRQAFG